jgi:hypothetical protein
MSTLLFVWLSRSLRRAGLRDLGHLQTLPSMGGQRAGEQYGPCTTASQAPDITTRWRCLPSASAIKLLHEQKSSL